MKQIEFMGQMFDVPEWAKWIAQDGDGSVYVYSLDPYKEGNYYKITYTNGNKRQHVVHIACGEKMEIV